MNEPGPSAGGVAVADPGSPDAQAAAGPWNPGLESVIPDALRPLCTFLRPENVSTTVAQAAELRDLTGLPWVDVVAFRPQRLALHELLVRVTASVSVPDGSRIEDLGISFREITRRILARHVEPRMDEVESVWNAARGRLRQYVDRELDAALGATRETGEEPARVTAHDHSHAGGQERARGSGRDGVAAFLRRILARRGRQQRQDARQGLPAEAPGSAYSDLTRRIALWEANARAHGAGVEHAASRALAKVVSAVLVRHGAIWGSRDVIASLAVDIACNELASDEIGHLIEGWISAAAATEGYALLPRQDRPVIMNTKGPSASGKSTLRPLQKTLAGEIGVDWSEFALISPDIWRKQLIDYASLGDAYKYGGAFSGDELHVVDQKLDRYMALRAAADEVPHLLIDRFRFDSFAPDSSEAGSNLLTRFGQIVYLFLMIAPPAMLVERAWKRGLEVGRYKSVDDTLAHAVEAYSGMPDLFFTWIDRRDKDVHFEFLDNSVAVGERPRTAAFGHNRLLNVLDVGCLLDVERFCRIDTDAVAPEALCRDTRMLAAERNAGFLARCVSRFPEVNCADQATGRIYLHIESGAVRWVDREALEHAFADPDTRAGLLAAVPGLHGGPLPEAGSPAFLAGGPRAPDLPTLGQWGAGLR